MDDDGILWLAALLLFAVPVGLTLSRHWARSRASGATRLDGASADSAATLEPELEPNERPRP